MQLQDLGQPLLIVKIDNLADAFLDIFMGQQPLDGADTPPGKAISIQLYGPLQESLPKQVVIAEPCAVGVEGNHKQIIPQQALQQALAVVGVAYRIAQPGAKPRACCGFQQELADLGWLLFEYFAQHVVADPAAIKGCPAGRRAGGSVVAAPGQG